MTDSTSHWKNAADDSTFNILWNSTVETNFENFERVFGKIFETNEKEKNCRLPLQIFVRGTKFKASRAYESSMSLLEVVKEVFPNSIDEEQNLKEEFEKIEVFSCGVELKGNKSIGLYYKYFRNPNGFLYIVISL